jgi:hypothetical protein
MDKKRDLTDHEKTKIGQQLALGQSTLAISKEIGRDHRTVKKFANDVTKTRQRSRASGFRNVSSRDMTHLKREVRRHPVQTSQALFEQVGLGHIPKSTRC